MTAVNINHSKDNITFSVDRKNFTEETFMELIKLARAEYLIEKASFEQNVEELGETIKEDWWNEHKNDILGRK